MAKKKTPVSAAPKKSPKRKSPKASKPAARKPAAVVAKAPKPASKPAATKPAAKTPAGANGGTIEAPKMSKSPLSRKELSDYRKLLWEKKREITGDMKSMSQEALKGDSANLSHMPIHMADVGSDNYEQELTLGLVESERKILTEIDDALRRIDAGTFGVCQATGRPIAKARLVATPWAKYSIEAAREMERGRRF